MLSESATLLFAALSNAKDGRRFECQRASLLTCCRLSWCADVGMQDVAVMCADPGNLKVPCVYCTSATPEQGLDALIRCWCCNAAFHKTCYEQATGDEVRGCSPCWKFSTHPALTNACRLCTSSCPGRYYLIVWLVVAVQVIWVAVDGATGVSSVSWCCAGQQPV
jgi:hypothetical protein